MSLEQLIKQCKKRDRKAQETLYHLYSSKVYSVCLKYSRNSAEAQDNLQDSFVTIFNKIEQFKSQGAFEGWLKRIAINTVLQKYRNKPVMELIPDSLSEDVQVEVPDETKVNLDELLACIQELPDKYRLCFNLYVLDGYSHREIAEMLSIAIGTSKSNVARARAILKDQIEEILKHKKITPYSGERL